MKTTAIVCLTCSFGKPSAIVDAQQSMSAFDVVSIRRGPQAGPTRIGVTGDTFRSTSTVLYLISYAYHDETRDIEFVGGPGWLETDRFDITAKPAGATINSRRLQVQSLLADRFGLVMLEEQRPGDVYRLKVARDDGKLGPDLRRVNDDCVNKPKDPKMMPRPSSGARPSFSTQCATLDSVAGMLSYELKTNVINETGLIGRWDFVVAHSGMQPRLGLDGLPVDDRPMLLSAVQEQLGLKVERTRGFVDVWVIKSIHLPTEN